MQTDNPLIKHFTHINFCALNEEHTLPLRNEEIKKNLQRCDPTKIFKAGTLKQCLEIEDLDMLNTYIKCKDDLMHSESLFFEKDVDYPPDKYFVKTENYYLLQYYLRSIADIEKPNIKCIIGARGIGKTITMNILLRNNFDLLCEKKIIFVRCDAKKFLHIKKFERDKNDFTISDYINIQFIYIFCEQLHLNIYEHILNLITENELEYDHRNSKIIASDKSGTEKRKVSKQIETYRSLILSDKKSNKHYARETIMEPRVRSLYADTRAYDNWITLSLTIQLFLRKNGFKFLKIVDGIDNIPKYDNNGQLRDEFGLLMNSLLEFEFEESKNSFLWFFMRNNTFQLYSKLTRVKYEDRTNHLFDTRIIFELSSINKGEIIKQRESVIDLTSLLRNTVDIEYINPDNIILMLDDYTTNLITNCRHIEDYLYNWLSFLFSHRIYTKYPSKEFSKKFFATNLLLNGKLFLNTEECGVLNREKGDILFNIFHFDKKFISNKCIWHGWCVTRILQLIKQKGRINIEELLISLEFLFSYDKNQIEISYKSLLIYGFTRYCEDSNDHKDLTLELSESGQYLIDFMFSRLELLYYCALDTPLPIYLIEQELITAHNNDPNIKTFARNCTKTSISFIQLLCYQHEIELNRLKERDESYIRIFKNPFENSYISLKLNNRIIELRRMI